MPPAVKAQSLNHWTAREVLGILILQAQFTYVAQGHEARKGRARGLDERLSQKSRVFHPVPTFIPCLAPVPWKPVVSRVR